MLHYTKKMPNIHIISCCILDMYMKETAILHTTKQCLQPNSATPALSSFWQWKLCLLDTDVKVRGFWYAFLLSGWQRVVAHEQQNVI